MNLIVNQEIDFYESYFMGRKYREKSNNKCQTVSLRYVAKYFFKDSVFKAGIYPFRATIIFQTPYKY